MSAESGRVTAEQGRVSAENARAAADTLWNAAEATRAENERGRVSAENARVQAEAGRAAELAGKADQSALSAHTADTTVHITAAERSSWNAKTSNVGTITGITMNGVNKGTAGVVDLGTVLTAHQDISAKANLSSPTFTGTPAAPTAASGTNTTQLATTAFVQAAVTAAVGSAIGGSY